MANEVKIKTKDKILNAAKELFANNGFDGTGVEEIARSAGVTKSLLYYYYESKNAILYALMKRSLENTIKELAKRRAKNEIPRSKDELFDGVIQLLLKEENVLRVALGEALKAGNKENIICDLPIAIFNEYNDIFNFSPREKLLYILFAMKVIAFYALSDNISKSLGVEKEELDLMFRQNVEPIFGEITGGENYEK